MEKYYGRLLRFIGIVGCCLVGTFGLIPIASAQNANASANASCLAYAEFVYGNPDGITDLNFQYECVVYNRPNNTSGYGAECTYKYPDGQAGSCATINPGRAPGASRPDVSFIPLSTGFLFTSSGAPDPDPEPNDCATRPDTVAIKAPSRNGTGNVCFAGCQVSIGIEIGGPNLFSGIHTGEQCTAGPSNPEPVLANPDPNANPCPNQPDGQCPGTETPENPSPGEAGGGFACDTPPVCSGSGIDCSMLYQTWRSRCAAEQTDLKTGEQLDGIGDSLKGIKDGLKDGLDGLGNKVDKLNDDMNRNAADTIDSQGRTTDAVNRNTNALNEGINGIRGDLESGWSDGGVKAPSDGEWGGILGSRTLGVSDLDQGGFGFPRQCPKWKDVSFSVGMSAITIPLSTFTAHCTIFEWTGVLLLAFASYYALRIVISD